MGPAFAVEICPQPEDRPEELDKLAAGLMIEVAGLDGIDKVARAPGPPVSANAKEPPGDVVGTLVIALANSTVAVALIRLLRDWMGQARGRAVTMQLGKEKIRVDQVPAEELARLIESWMKEHRSGF